MNRNMNRKKKKILLLFCILLLSGFLFHSCRRNEPLSQTGFYFDTVISVTIYDSSKEYTLDGCFALAAKYENLFSTTVEGSDIRNINQAEGKPVTVDAETAFLLEKALSYAELTDGLFTPTIAPLSSLWNFSTITADSMTVPDAEKIERRLAHTDYHILQINGQSVQLTDKEGAVDLGAIAKGYIADQMKAYLLEEGVESALINLGGNILAIGTKPDKESYIVAIQKPFAKTGTAETTVAVTDCSVVTSGIYERCFEQDGILYHHVLNPHTGYPVENTLASVTILSHSSADGDALSTCCLLLGLEKGKALIDALPDVEALFITKDGTLYYTDGFPR